MIDHTRNLCCLASVSPHDETDTENLVSNIIRQSFSHEQMNYLDHDATVVYTAKDG